MIPPKVATIDDKAFNSFFKTIWKLYTIFLLRLSCEFLHLWPWISLLMQTHYRYWLCEWCLISFQIVIFLTFPVDLICAEKFNIQYLLTSSITSICGTPFGSGIPIEFNIAQLDNLWLYKQFDYFLVFDMFILFLAVIVVQLWIITVMLSPSISIQNESGSTSRKIIIWWL